MVAKRHAQLGDQHGKAYANLAMRFLRSLFNFAREEYEDSDGIPLLPYNPVDRLNKTRAWYRVERRQTVIKPHQLPAWYGAVQSLPEYGRNEPAGVVGDYLLVLLFTGLRRSEGTQLRWDQADLAPPHADRARAPKTARLVLPLPHFEAELLSAYAVKRLVNHKMHSDVTAGYMISDVERLRDPVQRPLRMSQPNTTAQPGPYRESRPSRDRGQAVESLGNVQAGHMAAVSASATAPARTGIRIAVKTRRSRWC